MNTLRAMALCMLASLGANASASDDWVPVDDAKLDDLRGGFTTPAGLQIALGVERLVSINGELVSRTNFGAVGTSGRLIQQGANNVFSASIGSAGATVIQNSLNNQTIRTETLISANVNSAALLRDLNFQRSLSDVAFPAAGSH